MSGEQILRVNCPWVFAINRQWLAERFQSIPAMTSERGYGRRCRPSSQVAIQACRPRAVSQVTDSSVVRGKRGTFKLRSRSSSKTHDQRGRPGRGKPPKAPRRFRVSDVSCPFSASAITAVSDNDCQAASSAILALAGQRPPSDRAAKAYPPQCWSMD